MKDLVKIRKTDDGRNVVSAKELYGALGLSKSHWAKWHVKNIRNNEFAIEGIDYEGFTQEVNGNTSIDYAITMEFAKKLSMMAKTEKGEEVRNYFIEKERIANNETKQLSQIDLIIQSAQLLKANTEKLEQHDDRIGRLEAQNITRRTDLFTVAGWGTLQGIQVSIKLASNLGRKASKLCRDRGIEVDTMPDPRFGKVNVYPKEILKEVFEMQLTA